MIEMIEFTVIGEPAPQGSKSPKGRTKAGHVIMVESSQKVKPWRAVVAYAANDAIVKAGMRYANAKPAIPGPIHLYVIFTMKRPKSAKRGALPTVPPDMSKLLRSTEDALTDVRAWEDDSRVVTTVMKKVYEGDIERGGLPIPGAFIRIKGAE